MVTGGSYGGYMTLAVATTYNDRIAALAGRRGHFQLQHLSQEHRELPARPAPSGVRGRARLEMAAFFERTAPLNNAGNITKPLFVVQGGNDPRVPLTEAEQMVARVTAERQPGLVPDGQGRRPRLPEEEQRGLPVLMPP